jgi:hypothetical protein
LFIDAVLEQNRDQDISWAQLIFDDDGYPLLGQMPEDAPLPVLKDTIREFVKAVYSAHLS